MSLADVSVVIYSDSNPDGCVRLLGSLEIAMSERHKIEVILVYKGLNKKVELLLSEQEHPYELKLIPAPENTNRATGRNMGVKLARHDIVLLLDDMLECSPDLLLKHAEKFRDEKIFAVMGEQFLPPFIKKSRWFKFMDSDYRNIRRWAKGTPSGSPPLRYVNTANFSVRKETYMACGGHDETIDNHEAENIDIAHRITDGGNGSIVFNPEAIAFCQHPPLHDMLKLRYEFGKEGIHKLLDIYPNIYGKLPSRFVRMKGFQPLGISYRVIMGVLFTKPFLFLARGIRLLGPERLSFWMMRYMLQYYSVWGLKHALHENKQ